MKTLDDKEDAVGRSDSNAGLGLLCVMLKLVGNVTLAKNVICKVARLATLWDGLRVVIFLSPNFMRPLAAPNKTPAMLGK